MASALVGFVIRCAKTIPWIALVAGPILCAAGLTAIISVHRFAERAVEADVRVVRVEERARNDGTMYRPVFATIAPAGSEIEYAGNLWVAPSPHNAGEIVPGRVDAETGEIRSLSMLNGQARLGQGTLGLGLACLLLAGVYFVTRVLNRDFRDRAKHRSVSGKP
ncbi:MAG: DUF3592 domain-containing protein [Pseudomonadota bacterium]